MYDHCAKPCSEVNAEVNRAIHGRKKKIKIVYEHQLTKPAKVHFNNIVYSGIIGETPDYE
jgi:hypothetical protein